MSNSTEIDTGTSPPPVKHEKARSGTFKWIAAAAVAGALFVGAIGVTAAVVSDDGDDDREDIALVNGELISRERASTLAIDAAGGGSVTEIDLDDEGGQIVYEIEVRDSTQPASVETDVVLDARTGDVISVT